MKKQLFIIGAFLAAAISSCKKETTTSPQQAGDVGKIKTITSPSGMTTYTYDVSGRRILDTRSSGSKVIWEYQAGKVIRKEFNNQGVNDFTAQYELGTDGLVAKETRSNNPTFNGITIYNSDKQVIKHVYNINGNIENIDYFYSNGNYDSSRHSTNGVWNLTIKRTYYTDKPNTLDNKAYGVEFFGMKDKNLLKTEQYCYVDDNPYPISTWTYEFDAAGRVTKETTTNAGNINISYFTY